MPDSLTPLPLTSAVGLRGKIFEGGGGGGGGSRVVILSHYALILFVVILCTHTICGYLVSLVAF